MAPRMKKPTSITEAAETMNVLQIERKTMTCYLLGTTPLVMNRMIKKVREELLLPARKKNRAERALSLKHDPIAEFNESVYRCRENDAPTLMHLPNGCFKKAIAQAAIDIPGATKAQIGRLVSVIDPTIYLYGLPKLYMDVVRLKGFNHVPDIRTRAMFPQWACKLTLGYIKTVLLERDLINLLAAAGLIVGIGDGRTEKGSRDNGLWEIVSANDKRWNAIVKQQARKQQIAAMKAAEPSDADTEELIAWFQAELIRRERDPMGMAEEDDENEDILTLPGNGQGTDEEFDEGRP